MSSLEFLKDMIENYPEELESLINEEIGNFQALLEDIKDRGKPIWELDIWDSDVNNEKEYYGIESDGKFIYFELEEVVQKVIDEIGEDRLKKYWLGIKKGE